MSLHKLNSLLILAIFAIAAVSCKDEEEETTYIYLDGSLTFDLPEFVLPKEVLTMKPKGMTHPDDEIIGYYWKVTPSMTKYDTTRYENGLTKPDDTGIPSDGSFTHTFSDTLQTYTVYCYAFAEGYSTSSKSNMTTVVAPGPEGSITNSGISKNSDPYITVDGNKFYYTTIGNTDWFKQNLAYTKAGVPFRNGKAMNGVFGLFYSYEDALNACPEGWRLPTDKDWNDMAKAVKETDEDYLHEIIPGIAGKLMTDASFNEVKMWEYWPAVGELTNSSGLCMIPTGFSNLGVKSADGSFPNATFKGVYEYATFWTADKPEDKEDMAYYRYIFCDQPDLMIGEGDTKAFGASVRCVRDSIK